MLDDAFRDLKNILKEGESSLEDIQAINEIVNILLLAYFEKSILKKLYKCNEVDLYHQLYGNNETISTLFYQKHKINLCTCFTIEHKNDLKKIIDYIYNNINIINIKKFTNGSIQDIFQKYLERFNKIIIFPQNLIHCIINEIDPQENETCIEENCEFGQFLIEIHKRMTDESNMQYYATNQSYNLFKLILFNSIYCNFTVNKPIKNYDIVIANCHNIYNIEQFIKNSIVETKRICCIIIPTSILYNNGVNKNAPDFNHMISLTREYQIRKYMIENSNVYKIIFAEWKFKYAILFTKNNGEITNNIEFHKFNIESNSYDIKVNVNISEIKQNNYSLIPNAYNDKEKITAYDNLKKYDFTQSKIIKCMINKTNYTRLNYRSIMFAIYDIIETREKIKKHTKINIVLGEYSMKGYKYIKEFNMSIQGTDSNSTLSEIYNQCEQNKIKLCMDVRLNNGSVIFLTI